MRVIFMGTPDFAVPSLEALAASHEVVLCLTRPDAVRGRGRRLEPSPVKACATRLGTEVLEARRITPEVLDRLRAARADVVCVAAFGAILPDAVLELAPLGCVNVHASLLPRWRGAAPIQRAILAGDERVGVSIMRITHDLDAGAYCRQASVELGDKVCGEVTAELATLGARELVGALADLAAGTVAWTEQDESLVTYAAKVGKREMLLDPRDSALANHRRVQASLDAAPARLSVGGRGLRALRSAVVAEPVPEGAVLLRHGRVFLGCGGPDAGGSLELLCVKPDGRREMDASAWAAGLRGELAWGRV